MTSEDWHTIGDLQKRVFRSSPGSEREDAAERAISLALLNGTRRHDPCYFERNLRRDGRRSMIRSKQRTRYMLARVTGVARTGGCTCIAEGTAASPEAEYMATALYHQLLCAAANTGRHGPRVLHGMLSGEPVEVTAARAGVSTRTVIRTRNAVKAAATNWQREAA